MTYELYVLHDGYSEAVEEGMRANCTCTLLKGKYNVIIDTMTPWDSKLIVEGLKKHSVDPDEINYVISTHGHSDHLGNNNLFLKATHIVGHSVSKGNIYYDTEFSSGKSYSIDGEAVKVIPTPGHTLSDVSVLVRTNEGLIAIVGDLFEKLEDLANEFIWLSAGSESPSLQRYHRQLILKQVDWIVPGHGKMFKVTEEMRKNSIFI